MLRGLVLTLGPAMLTAASYWLALGSSAGSGAVSPAPNAQIITVRELPAAAADFEERCQRTAAQLQTRLGEACAILVRPPFVLGGDLSPAELDEVYESVILPTRRALELSYFDSPPDEPVTLLMFSSGEVFHEQALRFDGRQANAYYGYYERSERRIMLNAATGSGTTAHELTHALSHADFPQMPPWFDEGLAALHEECDFSADGTRLEGRPNWRGRLLKQALEQGTLPSLQSLLSSEPQAQPSDLSCAHARYFCLFLEQRGLLMAFYRKLRRSHGEGAGAILCGLTQLPHLGSLDAEFRVWLARVE